MCACVVCVCVCVSLSLSLFLCVSVCVQIRLRLCLFASIRAIDRVFALSFVSETRCLYVGGDIKSGTYTSTHGYSASEERGSNFRRLCLEQSNPDNNSSSNDPDSSRHTDWQWHELGYPREQRDVSSSASSAQGKTICFFTYILQFPERRSFERLN